MVNSAKAHPTTDDLPWLPADLGVLVHGHLQHRLGSPSGGTYTVFVISSREGLYMSVHTCSIPVSALYLREL